MSLPYISWLVDPHREILGIPFFPHGIVIAVGFVAGAWVMARGRSSTRRPRRSWSGMAA